MITRRRSLQLGALAATSLTLRQATAADLGSSTTKGRRMARVFFYSPHPDDEVLSMGLAMIYYIAAGCEVHLVSMNNGGALGVANTLNGVSSCSTPADHPYTHSPAREGFTPLTVPDVSAARILEARGALGAMAMISPTTAGVPGSVTHHIAGLPDAYGANGSGSSTAPVTPEGIAAAKGVIKQFIDDYPNSFHYTMSESDHHPDHSACGYALRELKNDPAYSTALVNARFFVSRLYWATSQPNGLYPPEVLAAAAGTLAWFNYSGARKAEYDAWLRTQIMAVYKAFNPAAGSYALGYHQVPGQFASCIGPTASIANLWHA